MDDKKEKWEHPGGKLLELGAEKCSQSDLLAILIGTGCKGKSASDIADELLQKYISIYGLFGQNLGEMAEIKGLGEAKLTRIASAYELARRIHIFLERKNK